jgi:hypothetical protein
MYSFLKNTVSSIIPPDTFENPQGIANGKEEQVSMRKTWFKKGLVVGIIVLVEASVVPSIARNVADIDIHVVRLNQLLKL